MCRKKTKKKVMEMNEILVKYGEQQAIAKMLGCCSKTVQKALRGDRKVQKVAAIRKIAIERGGVEVNK